MNESDTQKRCFIDVNSLADVRSEIFLAICDAAAHGELVPGLAEQLLRERNALIRLTSLVEVPAKKDGA